MAGGGADTAEEAQRNRYDQCARAGDDQKDQRPVTPFAERGASQDEGRQERQDHGKNDNGGGVVPGQFGDQVFSRSLFAGGALHQFDDPGCRRLLIALPHLNGKQSAVVDAAA